MIHGDARHLPLPDGIVDCLVSDPPYGYAFMNKDWDRVVVGAEIWKECLRVLKPGAFAFIMSSPRQDVLSRMIVNLQDAGFETGFSSIYWTYASGFPKAANVSKLVDKRGGANMSVFSRIIKARRLELGLSQKDIAKHFPSVSGGVTGCVWNWEEGKNAPTVEEYNKLVDILKLDKNEFPELEEAEREIISKNPSSRPNPNHDDIFKIKPDHDYYITKSATSAAKALDGSYAGFQPKPAVEIVLVVMKPLDQKSYVDQALSNGKGVTWLDDCRIPYQNEDDIKDAAGFHERGQQQGLLRYRKQCEEQGYDHLKKIPQADNPPDQKCRFPANLLVSNDVLNDGRVTKSDGGTRFKKFGYRHYCEDAGYDHIKDGKDESRNTNQPKDSGSFSRYFDLDKWFDSTFPFIITPKASKSERNMGLIDSYFEEKRVNDGRSTPIDNQTRGETLRVNTHPTVKPIKLMSYLISLGSRPDDLILDPFAGSGTTGIACRMLARRFIGIEINREYCAISKHRLYALPFI